jgi:hypothetical protein
MANTPPLTIVRAPAWQALVRRLDAAVARDGRLAEARDVVLRPVELLRAMAADAHAALADDVLRGDRLRAMLFLAWPYVAVAAEARSVLDASSAAGNGDGALITRLLEGASAGGAAARSLPAEQPYEPGVVDHAALLVLMLAAARVADPPFGPVFVESVHGLALASSAAEVLGRLDPRQPDAASLDVVLETLYVIESARTVTRNEFLRPFVFDPVERGRWRCLEELLATSPLVERAVGMRRLWDGATSDEIVSVKPKVAGAGDTIVVTVQRPLADPDDPGGADPLRNATVVFASADGTLLATTAKPRSSPPGTAADTIAIDVVVPAGASPGWIGFSRSDLITASNHSRADVRKLLTGQLDEPCVDAGGRIDPLRSVPEYGELATPRRRGLNRFEGGAPVVVFVGVSPEVAQPGETVTLRWETAGAQRVIVELAGGVVVDRGEPTGSFDVAAPAADGDVAVVVTPAVVRGGGEILGKSRSATLEVRAPVKIAGIDVAQGDRATPLFEGHPLDVVVRLDAPRSVARVLLFVGDLTAAPIEPSATEPGRLTFQIASDDVHDGMTISATIEDRTGARDSRSVGPLTLGAIVPAQVVLVRPSILVRGPDGDIAIDPAIDVETAHARLAAAAESAGLALTIVDLPWADDDLAVLVDRPAGDSDPALVRLLEALSRRALLTPRFEGATWLALLPDAGQDDDSEGEGEGEPEGPAGPSVARSLPAFVADPSIARSLPAYTARAVAVATSNALDRLFRAIYPGGAKPAVLASGGPRLAILGEIDDDEVSIEDVRADDRGEGPGAPVATRLVAVTVDTRGRELDRIPIRVLTASRPALVAALVPISSAVGAVELRDDQGVVRKVIRRARGELTLSVEPGTQATPRTELHWTWSHSQNARPRVSLLLRRGGLETPVFSIDPCLTRAELPLWRFAFADGLSLYATDGWNLAEQPIGTEPLANDATVVLRRLTDGRFFADIPDEWKVTWLLNGTPRTENTRTLALASGDKGVLEIVARHGPTVVRDSREVASDDTR